MRKRAYRAPALVEYGRMSQLTLGPGGSLPDIDPQGDASGGCPDPGNGVVACLVGSVTDRTGPNPGQG